MSLRRARLNGTEVLSDTNTETPVTVSLRFMVTPEFEIQTSYGNNDGDSRYFIGGGFAINKQINVSWWIFQSSRWKCNNNWREIQLLISVRTSNGNSKRTTGCSTKSR
jgi:hypothetical protein